MLELGTGWFPIIPLGLYLCGAKRVWTIDIDPLLRPARIQRVLQYFCDLDRRDELRKLLPRLQAERMERVRSLLPRVGREAPGAFLAQIDIQVIVRDAQHTELHAGSIDLLFSSGVLEYIPRPVLQRILTESRRLASPRAVISHRLNLVDQFSYFDRSITAFNYLRYTARQWRWRNSPLINQNRLRISDYRQLLGEAGFEIVCEESISGAREELARVKLSPEFEHYAKEDLLVVHSFLTARVAASQQPAQQAGVAKP